MATYSLDNLVRSQDFKGNLQRVKESIKEAKAQGCTFRTGPELPDRLKSSLKTRKTYRNPIALGRKLHRNRPRLELTGYGCEARSAGLQSVLSRRIGSWRTTPSCASPLSVSLIDTYNRS